MNSIRRENERIKKLAADGKKRSHCASGGASGVGGGSSVNASKLFASSASSSSNQLNQQPNDLNRNDDDQNDDATSDDEPVVKKSKHKDFNSWLQSNNPSYLNLVKFLRPGHVVTEEDVKIMNESKLTFSKLVKR